MALSAELRQQIHAALEKTEGHRQQAAKLLGLSNGDFNTHLYTDGELRLRWVGGSKTGRQKAPQEKPPQAVTLHRPVIVTERTEQAIEERDAAEAMAAEDQLVQQGLKSLGVNGAALDLVEGWRKLHGRHYRSCLELIGGGITHRFIKTETEIDEISREIAAGNLEPQREVMLRMDRQKLLEINGRTFDRAEKAGYARALIAHKASNGKKAKKPGYLNIQAQAGSKVQVVQQAGKAEIEKSEGGNFDETEPETEA